MKSAIQTVKRFLVEENGPTAVEYAVLVSLIILAAITAVTGLGTTLSGLFTDATDAITT